MAKSMTSYGRASIQNENGIWTFEILSINKRSLDIQVFLPKDLLFLDNEIRKRGAKLATRGQITLRLSKQLNTQSSKLPSHLLSMLQSLRDKWQNAAAFLGLDPKKEVTLSFLLDHLNDYDFISEEARAEFIETIVNPLMDNAFKDFERMKITEGKALSADILKRLEIIDDFVSKVESLAVNLPEKYRLKLHEKLKSFGDIDNAIEERAAKEMAFLAEKMDVTEEIVRLRSHISQMRELISQSEKPIGKMYDFLLQEAFREVNTLGSKVLDLSTVKLTLEMKNELEKIREQIQNIE